MFNFVKCYAVDLYGTKYCRRARKTVTYLNFYTQTLAYVGHISLIPLVLASTYHSVSGLSLRSNTNCSGFYNTHLPILLLLFHVQPIWFLLHSHDSLPMRRGYSRIYDKYKQVFSFAV